MLHENCRSDGWIASFIRGCVELFLLTLWNERSNVHTHPKPELARHAEVSIINRVQHNTDIEYFPGYWSTSVLSHCNDDVWWVYWLLQRLVISPNARHYSAVTHSCLEAVQPQYSTVRHWAALWGYWNSRLLLALNKALFETEDEVRFSLSSFAM